MLRSLGHRAVLLIGPIVLAALAAAPISAWPRGAGAHTAQPDAVIDEGTGEAVNEETGPTDDAAAEAAPTVPLDAFFGSWAGTGVAEDEDPAFFALMARDLDVQIAPVEGGFRLSWQTLIRSGDDTADPEQRLRATSLVFKPTERPNLFAAETNSDLLAGGTVSWARLHGQTLSVYQTTLNAGGGHELLIFDRSFEDPENPDRLTVVFRRLTDGDVVRVVRGRLDRSLFHDQ